MNTIDRATAEKIYGCMLDGYNYLATDFNGDVFGYEELPEQMTVMDMWIPTKGKSGYVSTVECPADWKETLVNLV